MANAEPFSPVADFASQAVINSILHNAFPGEPIVGEQLRGYVIHHSHPSGEEDSADLRVDSPAANALRDRLASLANDALRAPLRAGEDAGWGIGPSAPVRSVDELLAAIDRGSYAGGPKGRKCTLACSLFSCSSCSQD